LRSKMKSCIGWESLGEPVQDEWSHTPTILA
jgi:hypothetical protein